MRGYSHLNVEAYLNRNDKRNVYDTNVELQEILIFLTYSGSDGNPFNNIASRVFWHRICYNDVNFNPNKPKFTRQVAKAYPKDHRMPIFNKEIYLQWGQNLRQSF